MRAPLPSNESQRLETLRQYQILDTLPEPQFDELTELASQICETPIALISLIDADRQWFKSIQGIDATETHRDLAFCAHAILETEPLVVPNALKDERFSDNPLVTSDPHIRFYAGAPLISPDGHSLGTLCVIDSVPRNLTAKQIRAIKVLGHQVMSQIELRAKLRQMAHLVTEVESTKAQLERSNLRLQEFASIASHDLREPIRKVQAFGDLLRTHWGDQLSGKGQEYLDRMQAAAERMRRLITDLLIFSQVTATATPYQYVDLMQIARDVVSDLEICIQETGGKVEIAALPQIKANPTQMRQLIQNLICNALKFYREGVPPMISIRYETVIEHDQPEAASDPVDGRRRYRIYVNDNGIGFDQRYADRIFGTFQRLHTRQKYEGTGIGLAVCKRVVECHNGTIAARSTPGEGSTFIITLPEEQNIPAHDASGFDHPTAA